LGLHRAELHRAVVRDVLTRVSAERLFVADILLYSSQDNSVLGNINVLRKMRDRNVTPLMAIPLTAAVLLPAKANPATVHPGSSSPSPSKSESSSEDSSARSSPSTSKSESSSEDSSARSTGPKRKQTRTSPVSFLTSTRSKVIAGTARESGPSAWIGSSRERVGSSSAARCAAELRAAARMG
jgi:hypothetical protein